MDFLKRSRKFSWTLNNPSSSTIKFDSKYMKYMIYQLEKGENQTKHYQGFVYFRHPMSLLLAKSHISGRCHIEFSRGTVQQNIKYCSKSDSRLDGPWAFGVPPLQGKRSDLICIKKLIDNGHSNIDICKNELNFPTYIRYFKGLNHYRLLKNERRFWKTKVVVIFGPTGTGKSPF